MPDATHSGDQTEAEAITSDFTLTIPFIGFGPFTGLFDLEDERHYVVYVV